uniref:Uncharacterized protein n=1 Tax=Tanacetum cinerariifolium TaxID=118510 RepID=A0A699JRP0_TANCI|nr:hypothetical protein [Tanacetum cinerariifolium]
MLTTDDDNWLTAALTDTNVVAKLIVKLRQSTSSPSQLPLSWTIRRSRTQHQQQPLLSSSNKSEQPPRASPSTPLSWNGNGGGASVPDLRSKGVHAF